MCVKLPAAWPVTTRTPLPESPGEPTPYHANAVPLRAVQIGATPARGVPPVPTTTPCPKCCTTVGELLVYTPVGPPHTGMVGFTQELYCGYSWIIAKSSP